MILQEPNPAWLPLGLLRSADNTRGLTLLDRADFI